MRNQNVRQLLIVLVATAPLAGCQYLSAGEDIEIIDPIAATAESRERAAEVGQDIVSVVDGEASEAFEEPTVAAPSIVTADLIQSTDPSARAQAVARARNDPFASLPIPLAPELVELPEVAATGNGGGTSTGSSGSSSSGSSSSGSSSSGATAAAPARPTPPAVRVREEPLPEPSPIAQLPSIPQPVIAPGVAVSGIVQLGSIPYAIIRSGSEPERYVKVGDRIGNGSVRVKRIETLAYEPRVIFEENGIEVSKPVSSDTAADAAAPTEDAEAEPVAALPAAIGRPISSLLSPLPTPSASVPTRATGRAASFLPGLPLPPAPSNSLLQPARGYVPNSLILTAPEGDFQTRLPEALISGFAAV